MFEWRRRKGANILIVGGHAGGAQAVPLSDVVGMPRHWRQVMLKGTFRTLLVVAAISAPALIAPAMLTPAAAQVDFNLNVGVPMPVPFVEVVPAPRPGY